MSPLLIQLAVSLAMDAADQQMKEAGRTAWNEEDYLLSVREANRLIPVMYLVNQYAN